MGDEEGVEGEAKKGAKRSTKEEQAVSQESEKQADHKAKWTEQ